MLVALPWDSLAWNEATLVTARLLQGVGAAIAASDNWVHRTLSIAPYGEILPEDLPSFSTPAFSIPAFSIHVHAFYTEAFAPDLSHYAAYRHAADDDASALAEMELDDQELELSLEARRRWPLLTLEMN